MPFLIFATFLIFVPRLSEIEAAEKSQTVLLPCLSKLFNFCLSHGKYPQSWADGYISVIHKSGNAADPKNYRGITITSSVGKFSTVF
jgi:hypothetical protein